MNGQERAADFVARILLLDPYREEVHAIRTKLTHASNQIIAPGVSGLHENQYLVLLLPFFVLLAVKLLVHLGTRRKVRYWRLEIAIIENVHVMRKQP